MSIIYDMNGQEAELSWVIFRVDAELEGKRPIDVYMILDTSEDKILSIVCVETYLSNDEAHSLVREAYLKVKQHLPKVVFYAKNDPGQEFIQNACAKYGLNFKPMPQLAIDPLVEKARGFFSKPTPNLSTEVSSAENLDSDEMEGAKAMIPDSYDPCICNSGQKYKFCCKRIFMEICEAMCAAEQGQIDLALSWLARAEEVVGETSEITCRKAAILSIIDEKKSNETLDRCLLLNPIHPRAHYLKGLMHRKKGELEQAIGFYRRAIELYPETAHYHLNEVYNNLGSIYYEMNEFKDAKDAWSKALIYLPSNNLSRKNYEMVHHY